MSLFIGKYLNTLDEKGRVNMPAKFRKNLTSEVDNTFIITKGKYKNLDVYGWDFFQEKFVKKINDFSESDDALRFYSSLKGENSSDVTLDKQGRMAIPQDFLEYAKINKDVLFVGAFNRIELWDPKEREEYVEAMKKSNLPIDSAQLP
jgi:MraZ protein